MKRRGWFRVAVAASILAGGAYQLWRRSRREAMRYSAHVAGQVPRALVYAAPLLRLPTSPDQPPELLADGHGFRCPVTGRIYPYHKGVLDLLDDQVTLTMTQHVLNTPITAWAYDRFRNLLMRLFGLPGFAAEMAAIQAALQIWPGDTILDLACGHGNFSIEWAKRVGPDGLVIGLDISPAMLARAAEHLNRWDLDNVLLIRGDAHRLPLANGCLRKVNCSGGFHQFPNLSQVLREIARVSGPGATITASTFAKSSGDRHAGVKRWLKRRFALHFVSLERLGEQLAAQGYCNYAWSLPGGWFGYVSAQKRSRQHAE